MAHLKTDNFLVVKFSQNIICNVHNSLAMVDRRNTVNFYGSFHSKFLFTMGSKSFLIFISFNLRYHETSQKLVIFKLYVKKFNYDFKNLSNLWWHPQQNNISFFTHLFDWPQQFGFETQIKGSIRKSFIFVIKIIKECFLITILNHVQVKVVGNRKNNISD